MGLTDFSINLVRRHKQGVKTVMELGVQNLYSSKFPHEHRKGRDYYPYAYEFYKELGIDYECIDFNFTFKGYHGKGDEPTLKEIDLSKPQKVKKEDVKDLVTDFGTSEHVSGKTGHSARAFYNCLKTKHDLCKKWGIMISENPKTGHWPNHGVNYYTEQFYRDLEASGAIEIVQLGEHAAMGNSTTGINVYCIAKKVGEFPTFDKFKKFTFHKA